MYTHHMLQGIKILGSFVAIYECSSVCVIKKMCMGKEYLRPWCLELFYCSVWWKYIMFCAGIRLQVSRGGDAQVHSQEVCTGSSEVDVQLC